MTWLKLRTSEAKKSPKFAERWAPEQLENLLYFSFNFTRVLASPLYWTTCTPEFESNLWPLNKFLGVGKIEIWRKFAENCRYLFLKLLFLEFEIEVLLYICFLKIKLDWDLYLYNFVFANFFCIFLSMKLFLKKWETCAWFCFFFTVFLSMHEHQSLNIVFKGNKTKTLVNLMM